MWIEFGRKGCKLNEGNIFEFLQNMQINSNLAKISVLVSFFFQITLITCLMF